VIKKKLNQLFDFSIIRTLLHTNILSEHLLPQVQKVIVDSRLNWSDFVIYSYWFDEFALIAAKLKQKHPDVSAISRAHGWDVYFERHNNNYLPFRYFTLMNLDKTYVVSSFGAEYLKSKFNFITLGKIGVSRLGTQIKDLVDKKEKSSKRIVSCSSIIQLKRIDRIIDALYDIHEFEIEWVHFGSGKLIEEIRELASIKLDSKKNIKVIFKGHLANQEILEFYSSNQIDVFINTSETEGIPVSIMEAISFGIPCIAPNVGGIGEIIDENTGVLLTSTPNTIEISQAIRKILGLNEEECSQLKSFAHKKHQDYFSANRNYTWFVEEISSPRILPDFQECTRCLYSTHIYPKISFNKKGVCSICEIYERLQEKTVFKGAIGSQKITSLKNLIKSDKGKNKFDCVIGISGGVDSSYLVYLTKEWGLNPYVIHVDNGWNSEASVKNIQRILKKLDIPLHTHVINWQEMRDVQNSFIKASVLDIDLPFDNAFMAVLYATANKINVKYILTGHNTETEGWMPENFTHNKLDAVNIKSIQKKFGTLKLKTFPIMGPLKLWYYQKWKKIKMISPLDYLDYNKEKVKSFLLSEYDWVDYGGKHFENVYTRFYQSYILYHKFEIDKRISHYSTLINSGQIDKEEAKKELTKLPYDQETIQTEKEYFIKKMGFQLDEFEKYMQAPIKSHLEYNSYLKWLNRLKKIRNIILLK
jgi:N-acetyl sugar amidotransferase